MLTSANRAFKALRQFLTTTQLLPLAWHFSPQRQKHTIFRFRLTFGLWTRELDMLPHGKLSQIFTGLTSPGNRPRISQRADVRGVSNNDTLKLSWKTDIGLIGEATLPRSKANAASELVPTENSWSAFKEYVAGVESGRFLFRGQNEPWRLRTSFHRSGRADLLRFMREDIPSLHRNLSARTKHVFNLKDPDEYGAFLNLIQHHGYPTPLLDWTYSPYVAAFFAYRGISNADADNAPSTSKVRVLVLDQRQWRSDVLQIPLLEPVTLHFSIFEFLGIENERMIPQQAASTVTNIDDIEAYIASHPREKTYLSAIDLPLRERRRVIQELSFMGITASSLFPGLDEACEDLKQRNFEL